MSAEENIEMVRRGFAAMAAGDLAPLSDTFAADAVWHAAGSGVTSGDKTGREAVLAYMGELMTLSGGSLTSNVVDIGGSEDYAYVLQHSHAEREGRASTITS